MFIAPCLCSKIACHLARDVAQAFGVASMAWETDRELAVRWIDVGLMSFLHEEYPDEDRS